MRTLPAALVGLGIILFVVGILPLGGSTDANYVHTVEPATNGTLGHEIAYDSGDVLTYGNLSERGQAVFDQARPDSPYIVENESATAPDFDYTSDNVATGHGIYPIRYSGDIYSLQTERTTEFIDPVWYVSLLTDIARITGLILLIGGVLLAGWRRYGE
ncbi:hypothetical protein [Halococcus salifodinae]|uniref:DUF7979 domain-containing protein n=1 Tax=Halococcus salifodinae DSM 8989 TaxID=1227456 RepID=M0MZP8_9EURY|nr:hypothetical protein [Halococcus salifodinae]EMA51071.1 hypothetical protein C450_13090 [Halococcus salifodinae DSM 8989]